MNHPISTVGRVCLCEWSGPVTVTMIVSLLSRLKRIRETADSSVLLILHASPVSSKSMSRSSSPFLNGLPAVMASCHEVLVVTDDNSIEPLRKATLDALVSSSSQNNKQVHFFALLDGAFMHAQSTFPHEVLELRRQRIRSGTWVTGGTTKTA